MIPRLTLSGLLPPFVGGDPADQAGRSPYRTSLNALTVGFSWSPERCRLLRGLFAYRMTLRRFGFTDGIHWIDGSFLEDCETRRARPPGDIDLVTFLHRPAAYADDAAWNAHVAANQPDFYGLLRQKAKAAFFCDAYIVELAGPPLLLVRMTHYWFGLFSHERQSMEWKGMVEIPFASSSADDLVADETLKRIEASHVA